MTSTAADSSPARTPTANDGGRSWTGFIDLPTSTMPSRQPVSEDAAVQLAENGSSEQRVRVDLSALAAWCRRVEIAAAITGIGTFGHVGAIVVDTDAGDDISGTALPVATETLDEATTERTMLLASAYRKGDGWRLRAVGQGYDTGLFELATSLDLRGR